MKSATTTKRRTTMSTTLRDRRKSRTLKWLARRLMAKLRKTDMRWGKSHRETKDPAPGTRPARFSYSVVLSGTVSSEQARRGAAGHGGVMLLNTFIRGVAGVTCSPSLDAFVFSLPSSLFGTVVAFSRRFLPLDKSAPPHCDRLSPHPHQH